MSDASSKSLLGMYAKFAVAQSADWIVRRFALQAAARVLLPGNRVCDCCRKPVPGSATVEVWYSGEVQAAHYKRLQTCGGVWVCAVCAARITERRRVELQAAVDNGRYRPVLVTLTVRHVVGDVLAAVLGGLLAAYREFTRSRAYKRLKRDYGIVGTVKALEVTYGDNGWHPHLHLLVFLGPGVPVDGLEYRVREMWLSAVAAVGLDATWQRGATVKDAWRWIAEYVAKWGHEPAWGVDREVAKGNSKSGRVAGRSPTQLLADFIDGDMQAGALWREYAAAFRGRSQLRWSKGLRDVLGLGVDKSDAELAAETDENGSWLLAALTLNQWRAVLRAGLVGHVLAVAQSGDKAALWEYLDSVPGMPVGSDYHPAFRSVGSLRVGDAVKWMSPAPGRGYVRELMHNRALVQVWGAESVRVWLDTALLLRIVKDERAE